MPMHLHMHIKQTYTHIHKVIMKFKKNETGRIFILKKAKSTKVYKMEIRITVRKQFV